LDQPINRLAVDAQLDSLNARQRQRAVAGQPNFDLDTLLPIANNVAESLVTQETAILGRPGWQRFPNALADRPAPVNDVRSYLSYVSCSLQS
jgi:hypothetical protein